MGSIPELLEAIKKLKANGKYIGGFRDDQHEIIINRERLSPDQYLIKGELDANMWPFKQRNSILIEDAFSSPYQHELNGPANFQIELHKIIEIWSLDKQSYKAVDLLYKRGSVFENNRDFYDLITLEE